MVKMVLQDQLVKTEPQEQLAAQDLGGMLEPPELLVPQVQLEVPDLLVI